MSSSNGGEGGEGSLISEEAAKKLKYFDKNGKSEAIWVDEVVEVGDLNLIGCEITDEMLEEIILEWFIKKKLFDKIKFL